MSMGLCVTLVMGVYVLLGMRVRMGVYVLLVMGIRHDMGVHVVMCAVMPTRSMMSTIMSAITLIVGSTTMVVWMYRVMDCVMPARNVMVAIIYVMRGRMVTIIHMCIAMMMRGCMVSVIYVMRICMMGWLSRMRSNRIIGCFCSSCTS